MPNNLKQSFPGQEKNEVVFVFARPYYVSFIPSIIIFALLVIASVIIQFFILSGSFLITDGMLKETLIFGIGLFQLISIIVFTIFVFDFYYDICIVTDRRVVMIEQEQLFFRKISELSHEDVEDVSSQVQGILGTIFNYGHVEIQTAGEKTNFTFDNIKNPRQISAIVLDLSEQAKSGVKEEMRIPQSESFAVINNQEIADVSELDAIGALLPGDMKRFNRSKSEKSEKQNETV